MAAAISLIPNCIHQRRRESTLGGINLSGGNGSGKAWVRMEEWWGSKWEGKREGEGERDEICTGASTQLEAPLGLASEMHLLSRRRQNTCAGVGIISQHVERGYEKPRENCEIGRVDQARVEEYGHLEMGPPKFPLSRITVQSRSCYILSAT